ncbi:MAG: ATP-binding cassette domain-containing protein, partial [Bacteroidales bacterium]|nr:ATP-binding cassette domain-containing protein [Bacteroidales bacterium]
MKSSILSLDDAIIITGARENNLKNISLRIPKNKYILVTGVSGSGKSSLVHDVIASEGKRRFLEQQNPRVRTILSGIHPPAVDEISGMSPVISLDQISGSHTIRSTVGTLSGLYDFLRLLMSRYGTESNGSNPTSLTRSHFSFNLPAGACDHCQGLGQEEYIDPETFITDPGKSVLNGALSLTNPNGYVIYSQVTLDVLQEVCKAEGFTLDKAWEDLSDSEKDVIFYGSELIKVPFGKHTLESRMKWTGITAKPRDEGYYRGILTIMEEILKRDRNANILKYTKSRECPVCNGYRLKPSSLAVLWQGKHIGEWAGLSIEDLNRETEVLKKNLSGGERRVVDAIVRLTDGLMKLGLGYLCLNRESRSLSGGESKRIRLGTLLQSGLSGLIYTLDEPTVGLHPADHNNLLNLLQEVQQRGNTLVCIDHKFFSFNKADYWIEMGPKAGYLGGEIILDGPMHEIVQSKDLFSKSFTWDYFSGKKKLSWMNKNSSAKEFIEIKNARAHNLRSISPKFQAGALNIICGVSGAGKTTLLNDIINSYFSGKQNVEVDNIRLAKSIKKTIWVDQAPIGRTPRSNPATYIKLFDKIRDLFASTDTAKEAGFTKSYFSFNLDGGRCPVCHGAGKIEIGLSYLGKTEAPCDACLGKRFKPDILAVTWRGQNIAQVLDMEIDKAYEFFSDQDNIRKYLALLHDLGLGYLKLGQSSSTLSGGEAQRIKLVSELVKGKSQHCLYLLDEPTNGLHYADIAILLKGLEKLVSNGNTLILVEHDPFLINIADWIVELGPGGGSGGGKLVFEGTPQLLLQGGTLLAQSIQTHKKFL